MTPPAALTVRDAEQSLEPYRAGHDGPFGARQVGHLVRRALFGAPPERLAELQRMEPAEAVEAVLAAPPPSGSYAETLDILDALASVDDPDVARSVWLTRMVRDPHPFRERLALFWHGHFATSVEKVGRIRLMTRQVDTLQRLGAGPFGELLLAMCRDPAMVVWLDGNANRRHHPNENFARELFELFSLGIGHYDETDVLEAARAFSGWHVHGDRFRFNSHEHDDGTKRVLGREGDLDGDDVVSAVMEHPSCARHITRRLFREFVHPEPTDAQIDVLADRYRASGYDTLDLVRVLLRSRAFYAAPAYRALVKSPVALAVGAIRSLELRTDARAVAETLGALGQSLYAPPSVKGWDGGASWLNAATLIGRVNLAADLAGRAPQGLTVDPADDLDGAVALLLDGQLPDDVSHRLKAHQHKHGDTAGLLQALLCLPEYQLA